MLLLLFFGICAVAFSAPAEKQHFAKGRIFVYDYDGHGAVGLETSNQTSIAKAQATLTFTMIDETTAQLHVTSGRYGTLNEEMTDVDQVKPFDMFEEITNMNKVPKLKNGDAIEYPFRFDYKNGVVGRIYFDKRETDLSKNWKRSIASLFQVRMPEIRDKDRSWIENFMEMGVEGRCDTMYTVRKNGQKMDVTKSIDFSNCTDSPVLLYGYRTINACHKCAPKEMAHGMKPYMQGASRSTVSNVVLNVESDARFSVDQSETVSHYINRRAAVQGGNSVAVSSIKLREVKSEERMMNIAHPAPPTTLMYQNEFELLEEKFLMYGDAFGGDRKDLWKHAEKLLVAIAETVDKKAGFTSTESHNFHKLLRYLEKMSMNDLETLFQKVSDRPHALNFLIEALSSAPSYNTLSILVDKTLTKEIKEWQAAHSVRLFALTKVVSGPMVNKLQSLCESSALESEWLKQACWITFGSLINGLCKPHTDKWAVQSEPEEEEKLCPRTQKTAYLNTIMKNFENAHTRYHKILALQTLGNAALDTSVHDLELIIKNRLENKLVRMQAIEALHQLRFLMPRRVQSLLLPVFKDILVPVEIRMSAFSMIMRTVPERAVVDYLVNTIVKEHNKDLGAFVMSELKGLAASANPCEHQLADHLSSIVNIPRLNVFNAPLLEKYVNLPIWRSGNGASVSVDVGSFFKSTDLIPTSLLAQMNAYFGDKFAPLFALGFSQKGAEQFFEQFYSVAYSVFQSKSSEKLNDNSLAEFNANPEEFVKNIYENLMILADESARDMSMFGYCRVNDLNYAFFLLDRENLQEILDFVTVDGLTKLFVYWNRAHQTPYYFAELGQNMVAKIPTSVGLPLIVRDYESTMATVQGTAGPIKLGWKSTASIPIQMYGTVTSNKIFSATMWGGFYWFGVENEVNQNAMLPLDALIGLELRGQNWKLSANITTPREEFRLFGTRSHPMVIRRLHGEPTRKGDYVTVRETTDPAKSSTVERKISGEWLGLNLFTRTHGANINGVPTFSLHTESEWEVRVEATRNTPEMYSVVLSMTHENPQMETMERPRMNDFFGLKETRDFFKIEDDEWETKRVDEFADTLQSYFSDVKFKNVIALDISTVGAPEDYKLTSSLQTTCDDKRHCKVQLKANQSPVQPFDESAPWTMNAVVETFAPEKMNSLDQIKRSKKQHLQWSAVVHAKWGSDEMQTWNMRVQGGESEARIKSIQKMTNADLEKMSAHDRKSLLEDAGVIDTCKMHAKYNLTMENKLWLHDKLNTLKAAYFWNAYSEYLPPTPAADSHVFLTMNVDPRNRQFANVTVKTPVEKVLFYEIKLPVSMPKWNPLLTSVHSALWSTITDPLKSATCSVEKNRLYGYDKQQYKVPFTRCPALLTGIETGSERFAVLIGNLSERDSEKKLQINTAVMRMDAEFHDGEMVVWINKNLVTDSARLSSYGIIVREDVLVFENARVKVAFDGHRVDIALSQRHLKDQSGLCGGLSPLGSEDSEHQTERLMQFHESFTDTTGDEKCLIDVVEIRNADNYAKSEMIDFEEIEPIEATEVIERRDDVCFSLEPIKKCPKGSVSFKKLSTYVAFGCKSLSSHEKRTLLFKARHSIVKVTNYEEMHQYTEMPTHCMRKEL